MSPIEGTVLICLSLLFVWIGSCDAIHARIGKYPGVSDAVNCGKGRLTSLMASDNCMKWHKSDDMNERIINGRDISAGEMNFVVYISLYLTANNPHHQSDTLMVYNGAILNAKWVLTSAKAVVKYKEECTQFAPTHTCSLLVWPGLANSMDANPAQNRHHYKVVDIFQHPHYLDFGQQYAGMDLALLKLDRAIDFADRLNVNAACIPEMNIINVAEELAVFAGWGYKTGNARKGSDVLQTAEVKIVAANDNWALFSETIMAMMMRRQRGATTCFEDMGSPLIQYVHGRAVLIGIGSDPFIGKASDRCIDRVNVTTMTWARVSKSVAWIMQTIRGHK